MSVQTQKATSINLEAYFKKFRDQITGIDAHFEGPFGTKRILYADWTASGRLYSPIERRLSQEIGEFVANTHTETSLTGKVMTQAYHEARQIIKQHVNASADDVFIPVGTGMTGAIVKFQRMMGYKIPEKCHDWITVKDENRPVVFVTHMEHHSNQTTWIETLAKVEIINSTEEGLVDLNHVDELIAKYKGKCPMIASVTGCSNVTGIETPYYDIARKMHRAGGLCFVDFACSGPYVKMDMHPENDPDAYLDAIFFSPHKFLGGPGTTGALIFNANLYSNKIPDNPGGGTVVFTDPWGGRTYIDDIETREDGGTPGFLQTIKAALCVKLKEEMGVDKILEREHELLSIIFKEFETIENAHIFAGHIKNRLGVVSFGIEGLQYNLGVKLLNDYFGIQTRGGCSCAGTYGHLLYGINPEQSKNLRLDIASGHQSLKPGWIRMSIHPTMTNNEIEFICQGIKEVAANWKTMGQDYVYNEAHNDFTHKTYCGKEETMVNQWFQKSLTPNN